MVCFSLSVKSRIFVKEVNAEYLCYRFKGSWFLPEKHIIIFIPTQPWWCLRFPCLPHMSLTPCRWQHSRPSSTSRPFSWWGQAQLVHQHDGQYLILHSSFIFNLPHLRCTFLVFRPSRWPCRRWTCPSNRHRSSRGSRGSSRGRRSRGTRRRRSSRDVGLSAGPGNANAPPPLDLPHPHLPGPKHLHLKASPATEGLNQRYFFI